MSELDDVRNIAKSRHDRFALAVRVAVAVVVVVGWGAYFLTQRGWPASLFMRSGKTFGTLPQAGPAAKNTIAYIAPDGEIRVTDAVSGRSWRVGKTHSYYPALAWSHDGRYLAYLNRDGKGVESLMMAPTDRDDPCVFFRDPELGLLYHAWSPDDTRLAVLGREQGQVGLYVTPRDAPSETRCFASADSCYFNWRPDGGAIVANMGSVGLSVFDIATGAGDPVEMDASMFQTPAWPVGDTFYYLAHRPGGNELRRANGHTLEGERLSEGPLMCRIVASPNGRYLAYLDTPLSSFMPLRSRRPGAAFVVDTATGEETSVSCDTAYAFYWSPDSTKLMLMSSVGDFETAPEAEDRFPPIGRPDELGMRRHRWWVYDVGTGECTPLVQCRMTPLSLQTLPFFDQYAHSHRYWDPGSRYFLLPARQYEDHQGDIWVLDTTGEEPPRRLAEGGAAVWSWQ